MRTIKFRARRVDNHPTFWAYGYLVKTPITTQFNCDGQFLDSGGSGRYCIVTDNGVAHEIDISTLGQFTGSYDNKGREIYEGDIVEITGAYPDGEKGEIRFGSYANPWNSDEWTGHHGFYVEFYNNSTRKDLGFWIEHNKFLTVFGNIRENPELLEKISNS